MRSMLYPAPPRWQIALSGSVGILALIYWLTPSFPGSLQPGRDLFAVIGVGVGLGVLIMHLAGLDMRYRQLLGRYAAVTDALLERLADWAMAIGPDEVIVFTTETAGRYGFDPSRMRQRAWSDLFSSDDQRWLRELIAAAQAADNGVAGPACSSLQLPRGDQRFFEVTACRNQALEQGPLILLFRDVTDRRHFEASMTDLDRLAAIAHLSAGVAHNFNNILGGIMLNAGLLGDAEVSERPRLTERILAAADRGASLCRNLLTFARGHVPRVERVPVAPLIRDLVTLFETEAHRRSITVPWSAADALTVFGDSAQVQQILLNLLFHARDAIGQHGRIRMLASSEGKLVRIAVSHSGPTIPPEHLPLIFLPFFATRSDLVLGNGMGLAVSLKLAKGMNGTIEVTSSAGEETTFSLLLPAPIQASSSDREDTPLAHLDHR